MIEKNVCSIDCNEENSYKYLHQKLKLFKQLQQFCSTYSTQQLSLSKITGGISGKCGDISMVCGESNETNG